LRFELAGIQFLAGFANAFAGPRIGINSVKIELHALSLTAHTALFLEGHCHIHNLET